MDDGAALLAAIVAHPDADTPRLIYADYIEERGECERAELIRVQCALARLHGSVGALTVPPTHRCKVCRAFWVLWPNDGGWSLCSPKCGKCCDNVPMGQQIEKLSAESVTGFARAHALVEARGRQWASRRCPGCGGEKIVGTPEGEYLAVGYCPDCGGTGFADLRFRRGFPEVVSCRFGNCRDSGDVLRHSHDTDEGPVYHLTDWACGLVRAYPLLSEWRITDRHPRPHGSPDGFYVDWTRDDRPAPIDIRVVLPGLVWDELATEEPGDPDVERVGDHLLYWSDVSIEAAIEKADSALARGVGRLVRRAVREAAKK